MTMLVSIMNNEWLSVCYWQEMLFRFQWEIEEKRFDLLLSLFRILCKYLFSEVAVQAVTELDNKAAHCHTPVPQWHRPFL